MDATGMSGSTQEGTYAFPASHSIDPTSCSETILHLKERDLAIPFLLHMKTSLLFGTAFGILGLAAAQVIAQTQTSSITGTSGHVQTTKLIGTKG